MRKLKLYRYHFGFKILFWMALIAIYIAAILPQNLAPTIGTLSDKAHHVLAFIVLALLLRFAYRITYWHALVLLIVYGTFIEISQYFTPNRMAEIKDVLADTVGSFIGLKLYKYLSKVI